MQDVFVHTHLDPVYLVGGRNISTACAMFGRHVSAFAAVGRFLFFFLASCEHAVGETTFSLEMLQNNVTK